MGTLPGGDVAIYSTGSVYIKTDSGLTNIFTSQTRGAQRGGHVTISHDGNFEARIIDTGDGWGTRDGASQCGNVMLEGDYDNSGATGTAYLVAILSGKTNNLVTLGYGAHTTISRYNQLTVLSNIVSGAKSYYAGNVTITRIGSGGVTVSNIISCHMHTAPSYNYGSGNITITNIAGSVWIRGDVDAHSECTGNGGNASNFTVIAVGNIRVDGEINLEHKYSNTRAGEMSLTSSGGQIQLASLDMNKLKLARFTAAENTRMVVIQNFSTTYTGGSGTPSDPYITTQTKLRTPAGKKVYYERDNPANAYLDSKRIR